MYRLLRASTLVAPVLAALVFSACSRERTSAGGSSGSNELARDSGASKTLVSNTRLSFDSGATPMNESAQRGYALLAATPDSLPRFVGARMRCFSCHLDEGRRSNAIPLVGAYARFPKYMARAGRAISIQERVNNCFSRSLAGREIPENGRDMADIVAYLRFMSPPTLSGGHVAGEGLPAMQLVRANAARGSTEYAARCARCHGADGQGIPPATALWGARSFSIGASLARVERAASFVRHNMPYDSAGTVDDVTAFDIAAYIDSHSRPDSRDKASDWPRGDAPADVPYATRNHVAFNPPALLPAAR